MLQVQNLTLIHQKVQFRLVYGLTGVVHPGDKVAIIGEEGTRSEEHTSELQSPT